MAVSTQDQDQLHHHYVEAINSNNTDRIMACLSDDIVFQTPGEPELVGKSAVREWASSFFEAFHAKWDKTQHAFECSGDLAISRYTYSAQYIGRDDNSVIEEFGKGTCIYRRDEERGWLLAIDSWSTNDAGAEG